MATEQSQPADSDESIVSRMAAALEPEAEPAIAVEQTAQPEADAAAEGAADAEEGAEQQEETQADDFAEVEDDDGIAHKIPAKLKDAFLRRQDYTRKTMAAAEQARLAHDKLQYVEAREQLTGSLIQDIVEYKSLQSQVEQYQALNIGDLYQDTRQALQVMELRQQLERKLAAKGEEIKAKSQQAEQITQQHRGNQWKMAVEGAKQRIGSFTPGEDAAMAKQVQDLGFDTAELQSRFADPRFLQLVYKAAKWDALQGKKPEAVAKATVAPPVIKPGASRGAAVQAEQRYRDARAQLKKSGDLRDAARLFLLRG